MKRVILTIVAVLLLCAGQAFGAAYVSTGAGTWTDQTKWRLDPSDGTDGNDGYPDDGDSSSSGHAMVMAENQTVGTSPAATGTNAINVTAGGTLTLADGVTLTCKGDLTYSSSTATVALGADSHIVFDSDDAGHPQYTMYGNGGTTTIAGTSGARSSIKGASTSQRVRVIPQGTTTIIYADFQYLGTSGSNEGFYAGNSLSGRHISITHCTFADIHDVSINQAVTNGNLIFTDNTVSVEDRFTLTEVASSTATISIARNAIAAIGGSYLYMENATISDCLFEGAFVGDNGTIGATLRDCLVTANQSGSFLGGWQGDIIDCYVEAQYSTERPHGMVNGYNNLADMTIQGCVFGFSGTESGDYGDIIVPLSGNASYKLTVKNCVVLPTASGVGFGWLLSCLGAENVYVDLYHNTVCGLDGSANIGVAFVYAGHAGMVANVKSNSFWASSGTAKLAIRSNNAGTPIQDIITPANWTNNWYYNTSGFVDGEPSAPTMFSVEPTNPGGGSGNPGFVAPTRNLAKWAAYKGAAETTAAALTLIRSNPLLINEADTGAVDWVKAGFQPTLYSLRNAGHDSATTGAVEYLETGTYTLTAPTPASGKIGAASGNFTAALAENQYPGSIVITPAAAGVAGTFTPTTVTLTDADRTKTFTFTPSATGTATVSATNDGSMTDPSSVTYDVTAGGGGVIGGGLLSVRDRLGD